LNPQLSDRRLHQSSRKIDVMPSTAAILTPNGSKPDTQIEVKRLTVGTT
jgi:hypothetical protein